MYFGFVGHFRWGVRDTTRLEHLLFQEIIPETYNPPSLATACMLHRKRVTAAIIYQGGIMEGSINAPTQGIPELLPGYISTNMRAGKYSDQSTALADPSNLRL